MTYQSNFNRTMAFLVQSGFGSQASGAGGTVLRQTGGTPPKLGKAAIPSKEIRGDAQPIRGRHGMQTSNAGPFGGELSLQTFDQIFQALLRGTWDTEITKTQADFTSITTGANTIVFTSGNPITMGFRVNDIIEILTQDPGNNGKDLRITGLNATTITVAETLVVVGTPDTTCSVIRRGRKVIMPPVGSLVNRWFTFEDYMGELTQSRVFPDSYWKSGKFAMQPNGMITFEPSWVGSGAMIVNAGPAAILTNPTLITNAPMAALDATLNLNGVAVADISSFDLTIDNGAVAPQVVGAKTSPIVNGGLNQLTMNLTVLQKDMSYISGHLNETSYSLTLKAVPNMSEPKDFISINVPYFTLAGADISPPSTAGGAATVTIAVPAALIGLDPTGSGFDQTALSIQVSNNS